jgi:hypothetical protein
MPSRFTLNHALPRISISAEHLIQNRLAAGKPQDLADVAAVRQAQAAKRNLESDA